MTDAAARMAACTYDALPPAIQQVMVSRPVVAAPVEASGQGFRLREPQALAAPAAQALMPKLGVKSWRDAGGLGIIYQGVPVLSVLAPLLLAPTPAQRLMVELWGRQQRPLGVYLSPYVDFADISEARYLVTRGGCRQVSACLRGRSAAAFQVHERRMREAAQAVAAALEPAPWLVEAALFPDGRVRIVEVNPALNPRELASLRATGA